MAVTACATATKSAAQATSVRALFRTGPAHYSPRDPPSSWYAPAHPPQFVQTGAATWHADPYAKRRGFGGWLSRLFRGKAAAAPDSLTAIVPTRSGLPVPSFAYVTNVQTFTTIKVRVDQRAAMGASIISLSEQAARQLGGEPGQPLMVRVRYSAPVVAYREGSSALRTATRRLGKKDVQLAAAAPTAPVTPVVAPAIDVKAPPALEKPRAPVVVATAAPAAPLALRPALASPVPGLLRIQAGAFANPRNAERAVAMLLPAGAARIEEVQQGGLTLYRVFLRAPADRTAAEALRARVAQIGFADARLVRSS